MPAIPSVVVAPVTPFVLYSQLDNSAVLGAYPQLTRVNTLTFGVPYLMTGFWFSATCSAADALTGFFLVYGKSAPQLAVSNSAQILAAFFVDQNVDSAAAKSFWVSLEDLPLPVRPGLPVSLYACGLPALNVDCVCVVSLELRAQ